MSETGMGWGGIEGGRDWLLAQLLHPVELPDDRTQFPKNMLPITQKDRKMIDEKFGRDVADAVLHMQVHHARNGGINPDAAKMLYPDGIDGQMDMEALLTILTNHLVWDEDNSY